MSLKGEVKILGRQITRWNFPAGVYQSGQFVFGDKSSQSVYPQSTV